MRHGSVWKRGLTVLAAAALLGASFSAAAGEGLDNRTVTGDRSGDMAVDLVIVRPISIVATVVGAVGFVVALPFTVPSGSVDEAARSLVAAPFEYTFNRPLGDFERCGTDRHPCGGR